MMAFQMALNAVVHPATHRARVANHGDVSMAVTWTNLVLAFVRPGIMEPIASQVKELAMNLYFLVLQRIA
jgi:hypothetical protein